MRHLLIFAALAASLVVAACNTVEGVGQDLGAAGKGVTNAAKDVKN